MKLFKTTSALASFFVAMTFSTTATWAAPQIGDSLPSFSAPSIYGSSKDMTANSLQGRVSLLAIWASWCSACASEHNLFMKIKNVYRVPIYGILYKDSASDAMNFLKRRGNPYVQLADDPSGDATIGFDVYGTPEIYLVSPEGKVLYHQTGALNQSTWDLVIYPIVKHYQSSNS